MDHRGLCFALFPCIFGGFWGQGVVSGDVQGIPRDFDGCEFFFFYGARPPASIRVRHPPGLRGQVAPFFLIFSVLLWALGCFPLVNLAAGPFLYRLCNKVLVR